MAQKKTKQVLVCNPDIVKKMTDVQDELRLSVKYPLISDFYTDNYNAIRRSKLILFLDVFGHYDKFRVMRYEDKMNLIARLEKACYNYAIDKAKEKNIQWSWSNIVFQDIYHTPCYKISSNVYSTLVRNITLADNILDNKINIERLPYLSSQDICPGMYQDVMSKVEKSKNVELTIKTSSMYTCRKCKQTKCSIENRYNRSLDELTNLTITCLNCGYEFCA